MTHSILFVDDEPKVTQGLKRLMRRDPYRLLEAHSGTEALDLLASEPVDLVISDEKMPGMSGCEFLAQVRARHPDTIRMMLTGQATLEAAVRAINEGEIYRFFTKPANPDDLHVTIRQALKLRALQVENAALLEQVREQSGRLADLEERFPGITHVTRDEDGAILLGEVG